MPFHETLMPFPHAAPSPPCMLTTTVKPIESTVELNRLPPPSALMEISAQNIGQVGKDLIHLPLKVLRDIGDTEGHLVKRKAAKWGNERGQMTSLLCVCVCVSLPCCYLFIPIESSIEPYTHNTPVCLSCMHMTHLFALVKALVVYFFGFG